MSGNLFTVVVVVLAVGVVVKRFIGEPLRARDLFGPPVVLVGISVYGLATETHPSGRDMVWIVLGGMVGLFFGALRGLTPRLFTKHGHLWQRYTAMTLLVWAVSAAANAGVNLLATTAGASEQASPVMLSIGVSLLGEALTLGLRARATGVPFSPDEDSILRRLSSTVDR